jgi:regulator of protease activity HflC (stomatin/prohibitin superfamily)
VLWLVSTLLLGIITAGCIVTFITSSGPDAAATTRRATTALVAGGAIVVWVVLSVILSIHTVGQRQVGIVYNFSGTITGVKNPGVVMTAPWQHITTENVGVQRENFSLDPNNAAVSSDQQAIYANLALNYEVEPKDVLELYKTVGPNWKAILLDSRILQDFKEVTSGFSAQQITTHRLDLRTQTKSRLTTELGKYGIGVVDFFVTNLDYTQSYKDAINLKNVQVQQALQAQAKVAQARAEADQAIATARGQAEATKLRGQGEAAALRLKGAALRDNPQVLQLEAIDKLNPNATVIICTGQGSGNCPSFLPQVAGTTGK